MAGVTHPHMTTRAAIGTVIALLCDRFPACFVLFERRRRPLKLAIYRDIAAALGDTIDGRVLRHALGAYVVNAGYLRALRAGVARVDLAGNVAGAVTVAEAAHAAG